MGDQVRRSEREGGSTSKRDRNGTQAEVFRVGVFESFVERPSRQELSKSWMALLRLVSGLPVSGADLKPSGICNGSVQVCESDRFRGLPGARAALESGSFDYDPRAVGGLVDCRAFWGDVTSRGDRLLAYSHMELGERIRRDGSRDTGQGDAVACSGVVAVHSRLLGLEDLGSALGALTEGAWRAIEVLEYFDRPWSLRISQGFVSDELWRLDATRLLRWRSVQKGR